ncbi:hypothetical protein [Streptomyces sp. NPDC047000]|uniref:hypothetical protein n=1 Tax=Streptomyces sp. NPDC047000 TaxID=3155474 RepID=UPI0033EAAA45
MQDDTDLDPALVRRLSRRALRPGVTDPGQGRAVLARHGGMTAGLPLAELASRYVVPESYAASAVPVVYARSAGQRPPAAGPAPSAPAGSRPVVPARPAPQAPDGPAASRPAPAAAGVRPGTPADSGARGPAPRTPAAPGTTGETPGDGRGTAVSPASRTGPGPWPGPSAPVTVAEPHGRRAAAPDTGRVPGRPLPGRAVSGAPQMPFATGRTTAPRPPEPRPAPSGPQPSGPSAAGPVLRPSPADSGRPAPADSAPAAPAVPQPAPPVSFPAVAARPAPVRYSRAPGAPRPAGTAPAEAVLARQPQTRPVGPMPLHGTGAGAPAAVTPGRPAPGVSGGPADGVPTGPPAPGPARTGSPVAAGRPGPAGHPTRTGHGTGRPDTAQAAAVDLGRLTDQVQRRIAQRMAVEAERRGGNR